MHKCSFHHHHHPVFSCCPPSLSVSPSLKIPQVSGLEEKQSWLTFSSLRLYTNQVLALSKHITSATDLKTLTEKRHLLKRKKSGRKKKKRGSKGQGEGCRRVIIAESWTFQHVSPAGSIPPLVPGGGENRAMYTSWSQWKWHSVVAEKQCWRLRASRAGDRERADSYE